MSAEHAAAIKDGTVALPTDFRKTFLNPCHPRRWKTTTTALPSSDEERFAIQPEAIRTALNEFLADIVGTFEDTESGKDAKKEAGNCPITLLEQMKDEADNITNTMVGKVDDLMSSMMSDGLPSATLTGFSTFRKGYTSLNLAMHDDERLSDAKLAKRFAKVVRALGTVADTAMSFQMLQRSADGNLGLTIKAIKTVLGDLEASDKNGAIGAALTAGARRDPAIFPTARGGGGGAAPGGGLRLVAAARNVEATLIALSTLHVTDRASIAKQAHIGPPIARRHSGSQPKRGRRPNGRRGRRSARRRQLHRQRRRLARESQGAALKAPLTPPTLSPLPLCSFRTLKRCSLQHFRHRALCQ